jgi:hypothetical protein
MQGFKTVRRCTGDERSRCALFCVVAVFCLMKFGVTSHAFGTGHCGNDKILAGFESGAKSTKNPAFVQKYYYASLAVYLSSKLRDRRNYCGFNEGNVLFLVRQVVGDYSSADAETFEASIGSSVSGILGEGFKKGRFGLPQNKNISECWFKSSNSNQFNCEKIERMKLGKLHGGVRAKDFRIFRQIVN